MGLSQDIVKLRVELELGGKERTPPTEFRIFPFGDVPTSKGTFRFDEDDAAAVLEEFLSQGNELPIDYDHLSIEPVMPGQAKAAGWFVPEVRASGLWATKVRWTPEASNMLSDAEYRYFSPAFTADKKGNIRSLLNVAITNLPATKHMTPLVAASAVAFSDAPVVDGAWDGAAAEKRLRKWASSDGSGEKDKMDWTKYRRGFGWYDASNAEDFGGYKLPHHDVQGGKLVTSKRGVEAAAAVVQGGRGGAEIDDVGAVKAHLEKHYHQWGAKAPWEATKETTMDPTAMAKKLKKLSEDEHDELAKKSGLPKERLRELADGGEATDEEMKKLSGHLDMYGDDDGDEPEKKPEPPKPEKASLTRLTGSASEEEARATVLAWKQSHEKVVALSKRVEQLERETLDRELDGVVAAALRDGKIAPSQKAWALEYGRESLAGLKKFLAIALSFGGSPASMPEPGSELAVLSREEIELCKLTNEDPKEFAKHKLEMHKAGRI